MNEELREKLSLWLSDRVVAFGFAPIERFVECPPEHHPAKVCKDAATVIVYAKTIPEGVFASPSYQLYLLQRSYHTTYASLDQIGLELADMIESKGHLAVVIPSYAPMVFHGLEPWGLISLKHAARMAGLGVFGRNQIIHHPEFGITLRFGAVITNAEISGDKIIEEDLCPDKCEACIKACPSGALQPGGFQKLVCTGYAFKHGIYRPLLGDDYGRENIEMIINTTGYNYWISCDECLKACPNNRKLNS